MPISRYIRDLRSRVGHELLLVPSVAVILRDDRGRVLLARSADSGLWLPPGGAVEPDESPREAAIRETREETGVVVEPIRVVGAYGGPEHRVVYPNGDVVSYVMTLFEARLVSGVPVPDDEETLEVRYFSREELASVPTPAWLGEALHDALDGAAR
ncbi:MAG: NUDIX domain-containing protein [Nitrososphaerales archaeon]